MSRIKTVGEPGSSSTESFHTFKLQLETQTKKIWWERDKFCILKARVVGKRFCYVLDQPTDVGEGMASFRQTLSEVPNGMQTFILLL